MTSCCRITANGVCSLVMTDLFPACRPDRGELFMANDKKSPLRHLHLHNIMDFREAKFHGNAVYRSFDALASGQFSPACTVKSSSVFV